MQFARSIRREHDLVPSDANRFGGEVPKLQPVADMRIQDPSLEKLMARETQLKKRMEGLPFHKGQDRDEQLQR